MTDSPNPAPLTVEEAMDFVLSEVPVGIRPIVSRRMLKVVDAVKNEERRPTKVDSYLAAGADAYLEFDGAKVALTKAQVFSLYLGLRGAIRMRLWDYVEYPAGPEDAQPEFEAAIRANAEAQVAAVTRRLDDLRDAVERLCTVSGECT